ncbi:sensor domain-containing protein [Alicyclobacillus dauci]|uniref:Diguanylate cyclase n=1 Tax=Alicyclobacillus dauci TaxID=1475485 RepID=A0ABY6Z2Y5_9BACL|nr:diguanylate cyclase [Alicyclobacillus dauci]WAH36566.1 diguanylate cyclase [Alicyclobacillus dauci]
MFTLDLDMYKPVFETISDVVVIVKVESGSQYRYAYANRVAYKVGSVNEDHIGRLIEDVYPSGYARYLISQYESVVSSLKPVTFEDSNPHLNDAISEVTATPIHSDGRCHYIIAVAKDISIEESLLTQLDTKNQMFHALFMQTPDSIVLLDLSGRVQMENYQYRVEHGWAHEELIAYSLLPSIPDHLRDEATQLYRRVIDGEHIESFHTKRITKGGVLFDVSLNISPIRNRSGDVDGIIIAERNISEQVKYQRLLQDSEEKFRLITENMTDLVAVLDKDGIVKYASPSYERVLGVSPDWYTGQLGTVVVHEQDRKRVAEAFTRATKSQKTERVEYLKHNISRDDYIYVESLFVPVSDMNGDVQKMISVSRDVTERQVAKRRMEYLAYHDSLTDLPNRRMFRQQLQQAVLSADRDGTKLAVLFLDCDKFKTINDTFGHDAGDHVLKFFAYTVQESVDGLGTVARLGGDEFAVLLEDVSSQEEVLKVADRIVDAVRTPWEWHGHTIRLTTSIGVSFYPLQRDTKTLLVSADGAMYQAKQNGGNKYYVASALD